MDDCEALSDRIGILVRGKLNYIGTFEHLKEDYQEGVSVILRIKKTRKSRSRYTRQAITVKGTLEELKADIEEMCKEAVLKIEVSTYLNYFVPIKTITWSKLFIVLEQLKFKGLITSYSVCETTADQIFSYNVSSLDHLKDQKIMEFLEERRKATD